MSFLSNIYNVKTSLKRLLNCLNNNITARYCTNLLSLKNIMKKLTLILILFPLFIYSQDIMGKVYDDDSTVKGALIINITKNDTTYTDTKGNFRLRAKTNDSLMFHSLFHHTKKIKVDAKHFKEVVVFVLDKKVNELDEVLLTDEPKEKAFNAIEYKSDLGSALAQDIKNNPHLYTPANSYSSGINFIALAKLIGLNKLFKKKRKKQPLSYINYGQLDSLFSNSRVFNDTLLLNDLKIPEEHKYLFLEYCEAQSLNNELLAVKDNLIILDSVMKFSKKFLKILNEQNSAPDSNEK